MRPSLKSASIYSACPHHHPVHMDERWDRRCTWNPSSRSDEEAGECGLSMFSRVESHQDLSSSNLLGFERGALRFCLSDFPLNPYENTICI